MVDTKYRWDFIGLSTDEKPLPSNSDKVVDGSTFYCSDTSKLYVFCKDTWYEKTSTGGGGTTYEDFVGTDGTADGTHGLVPAPTTSDVDKFLKSDGTWATAGGGGITELSSADYDYPTDNPTSIAIWNLEPGIYRIAPHVNIQSNTTDNAWEDSSPLTVIVNNEGANTWTEAVAYGYNTILGANIGRFIITGPNGVKDKNEIAQAPSIVTTPGNSDSQVMTQNATTSMVFADPLYRYQISIGSGAITSGARAIAIGQGASASGERAISIGAGAECIRKGGVSFGGGVTYNGQMNIAATSSSYGYNNTAYRLLSGLYDGQSAHDAATVGQLSYRQHKPVTVWEVDGTTVTTGLLGIASDMSASPAWQLTNLDLSPYSRIKIYSKAAQKSGTTASASTTLAIILEMSLYSRAAIAEYCNHFVSSIVVQKPNDPNRLCTLCCAVSADKTSFVVLRMSNLYGTAATDNSDVGGYVFKIEGYYD